MTKQSGLGDRLFVDGYNLSGDINSIQRVSGGPAALDLTDITQSAFDREGGLRDGGIDFTAYFDKATNASHLVLGGLPRVNRYATYLRGTGIGSPAASCVGKQINYDGNRGADGSFLLTTNITSDGYGVEWGDQLTAGPRTDTSGTNGASLDGGAATTNGAQFYLHVTALTGTNVDIKIQDSADNSSWSDLSGAAFTSATAVGAERIAVTGTVRRYLRVVSSGTFTSATFVVNGVRNATAVVF
jgi:hypothetical protein